MLLTRHPEKPGSGRAEQLPPTVMEDAREDVHGGTSHYALNKLDPKQGRMKVNTAEGQLTPAKKVGKRKELEYEPMSRLRVSCPQLNLPNGHKTSGTIWPCQASPST